MPELTFSEVEMITLDVRREEIAFSHLSDDLVDHICSAVEDEMQNGRSFEDAYRSVRQEISPRRLKEIQEDTLYAVDQKYRMMKKTMKISAVAGTLLFGLAATFKIQHWPLAGYMAVSGAFILAFVFMPSSLVVMWKETHNRKRLFLYIASFFTGFFFIAGTLFKVQHWPLAGAMLTAAAAWSVLLLVPVLLGVKLAENADHSKRAIYSLGTAGLIFYILALLFKIQHWPFSGILNVLGLSILALVVLPWYTVVTWKESESVSARFIFVVIGMIAVIVPSALVTLNLQRSYEKPYFAHQYEQQALSKYLEERNRNIMAACQDQKFSADIKRVEAETRDLLDFINSIEAEMISVSEQKADINNPGLSASKTGQAENNPRIRFETLNESFSVGPVQNFLAPGCGRRKELDSRLNGYSAHLDLLVPAGEEKRFEKLLNASVFLPAEIPDLNRMTCMSGLHSLAMLKNCVLAAENEAISALTHR